EFASQSAGEMVKNPSSTVRAPSRRPLKSPRKPNMSHGSDTDGTRIKTRTRGERSERSPPLIRVSWALHPWPSSDCWSVARSARVLLRAPLAPRELFCPVSDEVLRHTRFLGVFLAAFAAFGLGERRVAVDVLGVHIGAGVDQGLDDFEMPLPGRFVQ